MGFLIPGFVVEHGVNFLEAGEGHVKSLMLLGLPAVLGKPVRVFIFAGFVNKGDLGSRSFFGARFHSRLGL